MSALRRRRIDSTIEKRILTGMIVSKRFLQEVKPLLNLDYFESDFTRKVAQWSLNYFLHYDDAPKEHIQDIYNRESDKLKEEDAELISKFLKDISSRYEQDPDINVDYLLDQTMDYFKKRELEITSTNIQYLLSNNQIEQAEEQIIHFSKISRLTSQWIDPFQQKYVDEVFQRDEKPFLRFTGNLGHYLGTFERGWLVGVSGTFKKGKTWLLQEFGVIALRRKLKVVFFSLEMPQKKMNERLYKRLVGAATDDEKDDDLYPVFDCGLNQTGECENTDRENQVTLIDEDGKPDWTRENPYRVCTACRGNSESDYETAFWLEEITHTDEKKKYKLPFWDRKTIRKKITAYRKNYAHLMRMKTYPRFSANIRDIERDLDILEQTEEFVPDVIIIDYADILKPEHDGQRGIEKEDETWMRLAQLAGSRHALVITATQLRRSALDKPQVKQSDSAMWIGKLAHVDAMLTLNQTENEKQCRVMRVGVMVHRYEEFSEESACYILQKLKRGQVNLDSEIKR
jgi:replicative DNA helicase